MVIIELEDSVARNIHILIDRYEKAKTDPMTSKEKLRRNAEELASTCVSAFKSKV